MSFSSFTSIFSLPPRWVPPPPLLQFIPTRLVSEPFPLLSLPPEIHLLILSQLSPSQYDDLNFKALKSLGKTCKYLRRLAQEKLAEEVEYLIPSDHLRIEEGSWRTKAGKILENVDEFYGGARGSAVKKLKFGEVKQWGFCLDFFPSSIAPHSLLQCSSLSPSQIHTLYLSSYPWPLVSPSSMISVLPIPCDTSKFLSALPKFRNLTTIKVWEGEVSEILELNSVKATLRNLTCEIGSWQCWDAIRNLEKLRTLEWIVNRPDAPFDVHFLTTLGINLSLSVEGEQGEDSLNTFISPPYQLSFIHKYVPSPEERAYLLGGTFGVLESANPVVDWRGVKAVMEIISRGGGLQELEILNVDVCYSEEEVPSQIDRLVLENLSFARFFLTTSLSHPPLLDLLSRSPMLHTLSLISVAPYLPSTSLHSASCSELSENISKLLEVRSSGELKSWRKLEVDREFWFGGGEGWDGGKTTIGRSCDWEEITVDVFRIWEGWEKLIVE